MKKDNFTKHGIIATSAFGGIAVEIHPYGDACRARDEWEGHVGRARWQEIKYTAAGAPYLVHHGRRYSFDEIMRVAM